MCLIGEKPINYMYWCACYKIIITDHVPCLVNYKSLIVLNYLFVITVISSKTREISLFFQSVVLLEHNLALGWYYLSADCILTSTFLLYLSKCHT